jgi:peptidoglycan/xylan/chitin deacetylase (PgdA/CDA1 family)
MQRGHPIVLCYHATSATWDSHLSVPPRTVELQVRRWLARGYRPGSAEEVVGGKGRLLHVTFDDAFLSIRDVMPLLERLGVRPTVFACSTLADQGGGPLDVPELAAELEDSPAELVTMGWDDLRDLSSRGVEVGAHTATHPHLTQLPSAELDDELRVSRERIEEELGRPCRIFAYPYGESDERVRAAARAAGYEAAFGLPGTINWRDRYDLPRVGIWRADGRIKLALKASRSVQVARAFVGSVARLR